MKFTPSGFINVLALTAALLLSGAPTTARAATLQTYRVGVDVGNNPSSGCAFSLGSVAPGTLPGFELQITVVVDTDPNPPAVVSAQRETCKAGVFTDAHPLANFSLDLSNGQLGPHAVVGSIPQSFLGDAGVVRLAFHALSSNGSEDALFSVDGSPNGAAITAILRHPVPALSWPRLGLLVLLLLATSGLQWWRGRWAGTIPLAFLWVLSGSLVSYAALSDGLATDPPDDAAPADQRAEIIGIRATSHGVALGLRIDIARIAIEGSTFWYSLPVGDRYWSVDIASGLVSATAPNGDSDLEKFDIVLDQSEVLLRSQANGRFFRVQEPDKIVYADEADPNMATGWIIFFFDDPNGQPQVLIIEDAGVISTTLNFLQRDPSTNRLHLVALDIVSGLTDPNSYINISQ